MLAHMSKKGLLFSFLFWCYMPKKIKPKCWCCIDSKLRRAKHKSPTVTEYFEYKDTYKYPSGRYSQTVYKLSSYNILPYKPDDLEIWLKNDN